MKNINSHTRQLIAIFIAFNVLFFSYKLPLKTNLLLVWCAYSGVNLVLDWLIILKNNATDVKKFAADEDSSKVLVFIFVVFGALFSLLAVFILLVSIKKNTSQYATQALLSVVAVGLSWFLIHTVFTLRYAHLFYRKFKKGTPKGLLFPGNEEPDYTDFAYFSFTIGMTFQVSDVEITSKEIRKLTLLHAILSFAFNTAIIALSINLISGLLAK
ncbi:MAG: DUF1345 domain-containing protein [Sphingobacteriales bacterium]|nr:MAG: DUF1345 domain-containing protein [Sphingobacteriales bacterium]